MNLRSTHFGPDHWPKSLLAGGLLLALVWFFLGGMFFSGRVPIMRDLFFDVVPQSVIAGEMFRAGHVPLWNTYAGLGKPFAADPQSGLFYPPHALFYFFSPAWAIRLYCVLHLWIAALGMHTLARHWKMSVAPALVVAISFAFSSFLIGQLEFANNLGVLVWLPWVLLVASKLSDSFCHGATFFGRSALWLIFLLALLLAIQSVAGYPEFVVFTCALALAYLAALGLWRRNSRTLALSVAAFGLAGLLALLLTAPQFLLSLEFLHYFERADTIDPGMGMASLQASDLLGLLQPYLNGRPGYPNTFWAKSVYEFWVGTCYLGLLPLLLAPFALRWLRRDVAEPNGRHWRFLCLFFMAAGGFGLLMAFGQNTPLYGFLHDAVPGFDRFRFPSKFLVLVLFALSVLAGLGYQAMLHFRTHTGQARALSRRLLLIGGLFCGVLLLGLAAAYWDPFFFQMLTGGRFPSAPISIAAGQADYLVTVIFAVLSLVAAFALVRNLRPWADAAAIAVLFANLFVVTRQIQPLLDGNILAHAPDRLQRAMSGAEYYRVHSVYGAEQQWLYGARNPQAWEWAVDAGVGDSWLPSHLHQTWQGGQKLARYKVLYNLLGGLPQPASQRAAMLMSVRYIVYGEKSQGVLWQGRPANIRMAEVQNWLPRAFLVEQWSEMSGDNEILGRLLSPGFDPHHEAIVEPATMEADSRTAIPPARVPPDNSSGAGLVESLADSPNRTELQVVANAPSLLVLNDAWYPGWKALVDDAPAAIVRTNFNFRGIFLAPGRHTVEFIYDPPQFRLGLMISLATLAFIAVTFALPRRWLKP